MRRKTIIIGIICVATITGFFLFKKQILRFVFIHFNIDSALDIEVEIEDIGSNLFQKKDDFAYAQNFSYMFHSMNSLQSFPFISSHSEVMAFAADFDFSKYDFIVSFCRKVDRMCYGSSKFRGKLIFYSDLSEKYESNVIYFYRMKKDFAIADSVEYPLG